MHNLQPLCKQPQGYANAIKTYNDAIKLNPDFPDSYYSLAVCEENLAKDIIAGNVKVNDDDSIEKVEKSEDDTDIKEIKLSENASKMLTTLLNNSISDYQIYLDKDSSVDDRKYVEDKIKELQMLLAKNTVK